MPQDDIEKVRLSYVALTKELRRPTAAEKVYGIFSVLVGSIVFLFAAGWIAILVVFSAIGSTEELLVAGAIYCIASGFGFFAVRMGYRYLSAR